MFVRIWRARVDPARLDEYERFVEAHSRPMFADQQGFLGAIFSRQGYEVAVLSFWRDEAAVRALQTSASYRRTATMVEETGLLHTVSAMNNCR